MYEINDKWHTFSFKWKRLFNDIYNKLWILLNGLDAGDNLESSNLKVSNEKFIDLSPFQIVWLRNIERLIKMLPKNFNLEEYTLIDVGCGSGISTLYFANFCEFNELIGFDISQNLIKVAKKNLKSFQKKKSSKIKFFEIDARSYYIPDKPCFIFMYNPFGFITANKFIENNLHLIQKNGAIIAISYDVWINEFLEMGIHKEHYRNEIYNLSILIM